MTVEQAIGFGIGIAFGFGGVIGGVIFRDRQVMNAIKDGDSKTHDRINLLKDSNNAEFKEIRKEYVRRDAVINDLDKMQTSVDGLNSRIDTLLMAFAKDKKL